MSIHKLTAGSGYDYLTRQVAAQDATSKGGVGLSTYYTEKGETPGVWMGAGMEGIDGLAVGDQVTADHMQSLFGSGHHPLADQRIKELDLRIGRAGETTPTAAEYKAATRLGTPYKVYKNDVTPFQREIATRFAAFNEAAGLPGDWPIPAADRARIRTEVAQEFFKAEHGRDATDARELAATIAKNSRAKTTAVAGYDLTFSPVKSFSVMWALADPATAAKLEQAHNQAVTDALKFIEENALFTREGTNGVRQVNTRGLVATAFTHRDSRAGDPDLHTHVAIANKVQTLEGKWLAIDGQPLHKMVVAASEFYNARLEAHTRDMVGVRFAERPNADARKRPVREIVGIDPALCQHFSKRRASVEQRRNTLVAEFQRTHGRPPTPVETMQLAQQATLETREAKHEPRTIAEQRDGWMRAAEGHQGSVEKVREMIRAAANPTAVNGVRADSKWFTQTAERMVATMEAARATWQDNHVIAEAWRHIKAADIPTDQQAYVASMLVDDVLTGRSISLGRPAGSEEDRITEPAELRKVDGTSAYAKAHTALFTTERVLAAEQRLVDAAGLSEGRPVAPGTVDMALLESAANGVTLNPGQTTLVREMATSGARLQLAIAPAGSGKTTAMKVLARAWGEEGGIVIGLGPSAAAAAQLGEQFRAASDSQQATADTLAMLTYALDNGKPLPEWAHDIDERTLVVIDEAGMADTISLDTAVQFVLSRGGSVRLIGDDQQLAAIGAGGVLRDIRATYGALQLSELMRFSDQAEGAASLALREGRAEALGYYLDKQRVHVGDLATMTEEVFTSWQADLGLGLDAIMLAPTRDLVADLNQRARAHRLEGTDRATIGRTVRLSDGNDSSIGDVIITRRNQRSLRMTRTDWVKNGDRWTILDVTANGGLQVQHMKTGRLLKLPASYVQECTDLGYACTVHTAQGVTADSMHGLANGEESRQQLYTMMTRGRHANHVYLGVVGDGDPHSVIRPELLNPRTPTDVLERILARDASPKSATTLRREATDPAIRLAEAAAAYTDALYVAAEKTLGSEVVARLDEAVDRVVPGLSEEAAWPALRAHLLLLGAAGEDPVVMLTAAAGDRELTTSRDSAAVLDWRLDASGLRNSGRGPLPWLQAAPAAIAQHETWGPYLEQRAQLVTTLAEQVRERAASSIITPTWATNGTRLDPTVRGNVEVWRAAMGVDPADQRPTGPTQQQKVASTWQRRLNKQVAGDRTPAVREWKHVLTRISSSIAGDEFSPLLAERLASMSRAGVNARSLITAAAQAGPLPDDHAAAALWWRISRHVAPAVAARLAAREQVTAATWTQQLVDLIGTDRATALQQSSWWPALVSVVDHGLQRGWELHRLLDLDPTNSAGLPADVDECQAMVWRASLSTDDIPTDNPDQLWDIPESLPPEDLEDLLNELASEHQVRTRDTDSTDGDEQTHPEHTTVPGEDWTPLDDIEAPYDPAWEEAMAAPERDHGQAPVDTFDVDRTLLFARLSRDVRVIDEKTFYSEADIKRQMDRADAWHVSPVSRDRMLQINEMTQQFFERQFTAQGSWGRPYLAERFGTDLAGHEHFRPGQAPAGWNNLVKHLRRQGVTDEEMVATGVATIASNGNLIDRFRDRVMFPITHPGSNGANRTEILGFVGRRHSEVTDDRNPKYLNTGATPLFNKGAQLFGAIEPMLAAGATPVIVEGPMDAIAVTLATEGAQVGVAPLGTSLTEDQVAQLARQFQRTGRDPVVATDGDLAGQVAAERDFWLLTGMGLDPSHVQMREGSDPADLLTEHGPAALAETLSTPRSLGEVLLTERLDHLPNDRARLEAAKVLAAQPGRAWEPGLDQVVARLQISQIQARRDLAAAVTAWDADPRKAANDGVNGVSDVKARIEREKAAALTPAERWAPVAAAADARLVEQLDWPLLANMMQEISDAGHDVAGTVRRLVDEKPLADQPARDLRYRLVSRVDVTVKTGEGPTVGARRGAEEARRKAPTPPTQRPDGPRR
ncbi:DNA primase catalytic core [Marmoricola sp. URHA0025 HA25]